MWNTEFFVAEKVLAGPGYLGVKGKWKDCNNEVALFNIYALQEVATKKDLWNELLNVQAITKTPWVLMGDFNVVRRPAERKGSKFNAQKARDFYEFINVAHLMEVSMRMKSFTWIDRGGSKLSKLDRFLISRDIMDF